VLLTEMETDLRLVKKARRAAIGTSAAGIIVPFACWFALGTSVYEVIGWQDYA
jgi:Kef-type K+ transport system membrane component KefB